MLAAVALLALAGIGLLDALYFVLVTYRAIPPDPRWLPPVCRMDAGTCARVVDTRWARILGVPNAVLGLAWYALVAAAAAAWLATGDLPARPLLLAGALAAAGMSAVLAWALLVRLRTVCTLCFLGHAVNLAVLVLLALA